MAVEHRTAQTQLAAQAVTAVEHRTARTQLAAGCDGGGAPNSSDAACGSGCDGGGAPNSSDEAGGSGCDGGGAPNSSDAACGSGCDGGGAPNSSTQLAAQAVMEAEHRTARMLLVAIQAQRQTSPTLLAHLAEHQRARCTAAIGRLGIVANELPCAEPCAAQCRMPRPLRHSHPLADHGSPVTKLYQSVDAIQMGAPWRWQVSTARTRYGGRSVRRRRGAPALAQRTLVSFGRVAHCPWLLHGGGACVARLKHACPLLPNNSDWVAGCAVTQRARRTRRRMSRTERIVRHEGRGRCSGAPARAAPTYKAGSRRALLTPKLTLITV